MKKTPNCINNIAEGTVHVSWDLFTDRYIEAEIIHLSEVRMMVYNYNV